MKIVSVTAYNDVGSLRLKSEGKTISVFKNAMKEYLSDLIAILLLRNCCKESHHVWNANIYLHTKNNEKNFFTLFSQ